MSLAKNRADIGSDTERAVKHKIRFANDLREGNKMSNFQTYELLPKEIYTIYGEAGLRWLDPKIIGVLEFVRSTFGKPVIVNDWYMGGQFNERSIRIPGHTHYDWRKPGHQAGEPLTLTCKVFRVLRFSSTY